MLRCSSGGDVPTGPPSFADATLFAWDLSAGLSQVLLIDEAAVRSIDVLSHVHPTDVLVVFSFRRYQRQSVLVADSPTAVALVIHLASTVSIASAKGARRSFAEREQLNQILNSYVE